MVDDRDLDECVTDIVELCGTPSPTGYTRLAEEWIERRLTSMDVPLRRSRKGSIVSSLGGAGAHLLLAAHVDTLGVMVRAVKPNGRLRYTQIGSFPDLYVVGETCVLHTREGRRYSGTIWPINPAFHVNPKLGELSPNDENLEIVLDLPVSSADQVRNLGIAVGDIVSLDARTTVTENGYVKSRHLDDKASVAILISLARMIKEGRVRPAREVSILFTTYEEVGHGGAAGIPDGVEEMIAVDMGAVGGDLSATEHHVSICAKDSGGPYDHGVTTRLVETAREAELPYAVDIYPRYGSDVEVTLRAGHDLLHGLVGPGVSASHGYERTHRDGLRATLELLARYVSRPR